MYGILGLRLFNPTIVLWRWWILNVCILCPISSFLAGSENKAYFVNK
jgi:hypothetical protein